MSQLASCIYEGTVVHKRLTPRQHAFAYRVFALCLDVDEIDRVDRGLRFFSRGKRNLLGFWDTDLGEPGTDSVGTKARRLLDLSGLGSFGARIELVCYPRILGFVFNPLSVYFCRDDAGTVGAVIYEVTNTSGERILQSAATAPSAIFMSLLRRSAQSCRARASPRLMAAAKPSGNALCTKSTAG